MFDQEINAIYQKLTSICPSELVKYKNSLLSPEEQIKVAISIILSGYMYNNLPTFFNSHSSYEVVKLFFKNTAHKFREFSDKEIPSVINQWLSNLYLSDKSHKLYLTVEDRSQEFELNIKVSFDCKDEPIEFHQAVSHKDNPNCV